MRLIAWLKPRPTRRDPPLVLAVIAMALEDESPRWRQWKDGVYVSFEPPAPGETIFFEPVGVPLL